MPAIPVLALFALVAAGCASTKVTDQQSFTSGALPRPGNILVYNFAATPADLPADSALAKQPDLDAPPQTAGQIAQGRSLGVQMAGELVGQLHGMGMPAERVWSDQRPQLNDLVIHGCLLSVNEGSTTKRMAIGFGSGASELKVAVEVYQVTAEGLRKVESSDVQGKGGKAPGVSLGLAALLVTGNPVGLLVGGGVKVYNEASGNNKVEGRASQIVKQIGDQLKILFQQQGWVH
ncbi:MAG TPA: DUF4410 domain-containing protein [Candidatus Acidoferrum sp.]|nr:DUF4410 domain-containing protein [Candidatus Acidoferrum sp.]